MKAFSIAEEKKGRESYCQEGGFGGGRNVPEEGGLIETAGRL